MANFPQDNYTFPQKSRSSGMQDGDNGYIGSSESAGCGNQDSPNRLPDPNTDWTTSESGEGVNGQRQTPTPFNRG